MRIIVGLFLSIAFCQAGSAPPGITGVWVLDTHKSHFVSSDVPTKLALEVEAQESGELCVWRIRTDSRGQHLERVHYAVALHLSAPTKGTERISLRNETTAVSEEWLLDEDGTLTVQIGFGLGSVPSEQLVIKPAQGLPLFPEDMREGGLLP
jgi:hypothetical protein